MDIEGEIDALLYVLFTKIALLYSEKSITPFYLKGSSSLNRGLSIIERKSHDIDLTYSLDLLGLQQVSQSQYSSRSKLEQAVLEFDKRCASFNHQLSEALKRFNYSTEIDRSNPLNIKVILPDNRRTILLETGARSLEEKLIKVKIEYIYPYELYIVPPEQSLMERIFGIYSDVYTGKCTVKHIKFMYDIIMIDRFNPKLIYNRNLLFRIADFNYIYYRWNREVCREIKTGPIRLIPSNLETLGHYREEWNSMASEFKNEELPFSFDQLIGFLKQIEIKINKN